jgi:hypothetical protein
MVAKISDGPAVSRAAVATNDFYRHAIQCIFPHLTICHSSDSPHRIVASGVLANAAALRPPQEGGLLPIWDARARPLNSLNSGNVSCRFLDAGRRRWLHDRGRPVSENPHKMRIAVQRPNVGFRRLVFFTPRQGLSSQHRMDCYSPGQLVRSR